MTAAVPQDSWHVVRTALRGADERFRAMLVAAPDAGAPATAQWSIAESAAHVLSIAQLYVFLLEEGAEPLPVPGIEGILSTTNVDTVADVNDYVLRYFTERDAAVLAERLGTAVGRILAATEHTDPRTPVRWLGDSLVPVAGVLAHLVNELLVHGWDIARALRVPWPMPDEHAALYWELFFLGMLRLEYGALLNMSLKMPRRPTAVQFRSAFTTTETIVLGDGRVWIAPPGHPHDVRVWFRPARFNLLLFGRIGTAHAAVRRDVVVGGPRPWRLPGFLRVVHMPNGRLAPPRTGS
ncbi:maleylpyruvate isomerase N-terminal domain-containing protein [Dactylosporangium sp. NPDC051485]|uniref:maleylpyruvate isomerase N-terminal domain-containing protein n=1 Tax=Dactylosporangium sp. NPDC051485 TaxID=3154846 RepID=UPI00343A2362